VILRPSPFIQNIPESTIPAIDETGNFYVNAGDARISMTHTRDAAAVATDVLTQPRHEGAHYGATGPEAPSIRTLRNSCRRRWAARSAT
jgi:uncharacterized protein YbjT (DUF2867 family)